MDSVPWRAALGQNRQDYCTEGIELEIEGQSHDKRPTSELKIHLFSNSRYSETNTHNLTFQSALCKGRLGEIADRI